MDYRLLNDYYIRYSGYLQSIIMILLFCEPESIKKKSFQQNVITVLVKLSGNGSDLHFRSPWFESLPE
jgi:hypothetical protein